MRHRLLALAGSLWALAAWPAFAQRPNPCDHYIPTGEALPRQDTVRGAMVLHDEPTSRGRRVGATRSGEPVEVLKECGAHVMIRTSNGTVGWMSTSFLPHEEMLARAAVSRPVTSDRDCELRYDERSRLLDTCKAELAQRKAREEELASAVWLDAGQLQRFFDGNTMTYTARPGVNGRRATAPELVAYYRNDGEVFVLIGAGKRPWRGRWLVKDDNICLPESGVGCGRIRQNKSGETIWVGHTGEYACSSEPGDSQKAVSLVSAAFPYAAPLPVPEGLENVAHPVMGW